MQHDRGEVYIPSIDICAICADGECDGIQCVADIDSNDERDQWRLEELQNWVRWGKAWEQMQEQLACAENRNYSTLGRE
jgi:hypothetical protein